MGMPRETSAFGSGVSLAQQNANGHAFSNGGRLGHSRGGRDARVTSVRRRSERVNPKLDLFRTFAPPPMWVQAGQTDSAEGSFGLSLL